MPPLMNSNLDKKYGLRSIKMVAGSILAIMIIAYGLFESFAILSGPTLEVTSPVDGATLNDPLIRVEGQTKRIAKILINDRQIFASDDGRFSEPLLMGSGYNIIEVEVLDLFGRKITKKIRVVLE